MLTFMIWDFTSPYTNLGLCVWVATNLGLRMYGSGYIYILYVHMYWRPLSTGMELHPGFAGQLLPPFSRHRVLRASSGPLSNLSGFVCWKPSSTFWVYILKNWHVNFQYVNYSRCGIYYPMRLFMRKVLINRQLQYITCIFYTCQLSYYLVSFIMFSDIILNEYMNILHSVFCYT